MPSETAKPARGALSDWLAPITAGFVAVLIGFASSAVIVFQAAAASGATPGQVSSWILALCIGMAVTSIGPSLVYRQPVLTAWSTPGAALLAVGLVGVPMSDAIGAFIVCGLMITVFGVTGWFERAMAKIPIAIASAMLAGVLFRFGADVFIAARTQWPLVLAMFVTYLGFKRWLPRYAVIGVLAVGVAAAASAGLLHVESLQIALARPEFVMPTFSLPVLISVSVPLFIVTMASQNLPGVAVMRAAGYPTPVSALLVWTGVCTMLLAPFGAFALNLAAITAAICMGKEAHDDPALRHRASIAAGVFYLLAGLFGATVVGLFVAFPKELIMALAGLALLATIGNGLHVAMQDERQREPALITFLVTASGASLMGIGSAFWGLVAGFAAMALLRRR